MKKNASLLILFVVLLAGLKVKAQEEAVQIYDQVFMRDGRILQGHILYFQDSDGDMTFTDIEGNNYSISRKEYDYFRENVLYISGNDTLVVRPRKSQGFGGSVGLLLGAYSSEYGSNSLPLSLYVAAGKYLTRKNYIGLAAEYSFVSGEINTYINPKAFIKHQYDAHKKNVSSYIIGELGYMYVKGNLPTQYIRNSGERNFSRPNIFQEADFINLTVGHGFGFILKNTNSVSLEIIVARQIALERNLLEGYSSTHTLDTSVEKPSYTTFGLRFMINL